MSSSFDVFCAAVEKHFAFLMAEHGFEPPVRDMKVGASVRFESPKLALTASYYKGEINIAFWVKVDTAVIRPYSKRMFYLSAIIKHLAPQDRPYEVLKTWPRRGYEYDAVQLVEFDAGLVKKYGSGILAGDLKPLEELSVIQSKK